ncbi:hypothetical protein K3495_g11238 [Podosphaera aphanis]|nr:hypothetical protein K3495_g11238 [Podosphaera aphanis]
MESAQEESFPQQVNEHDENQANSSCKPPIVDSTQLRTRLVPRTCRICLEEVHPTFDVPDEAIPSVFHPIPKIRWISEDPTSGRLIRPCLCRGSQKYVHEGCLQQWRHADPAYQKQQNFWECPTCKFRYRLERMAWSRIITSTFARIGITFTIMSATVFFFGFVADPIINIYTNPIDTIVSLSTDGAAALQADRHVTSWTVHFLKGFASLGVVGISKDVFLAWQWIFRGFGVRTVRRRGHTPQDVLSDIPWTVVIAGAATFLTAVWRLVLAWTNSMLEKAGERVADVQGGDDDDDDDDDDDEVESLGTPAEPPKSQ